MIRERNDQREECSDGVMISEKVREKNNQREK